MALPPRRTSGRTTLAVIAAVASLTVTSQAAAESERSFEIYGFAMTDYIQDSKRVDRQEENGGNRRCGQQDAADETHHYRPDAIRRRWRPEPD